MRRYELPPRLSRSQRGTAGRRRMPARPLRNPLGLGSDALAYGRTRTKPGCPTGGQRYQRLAMGEPKEQRVSRAMEISDELTQQRLGDAQDVGYLLVTAPEFGGRAQRQIGRGRL